MPLCDMSWKLFPGTSRMTTCTISMGVRCELRYWGGGSMNVPCKIPNGKVLAHLGLKPKVLPSSPFHKKS